MREQDDPAVADKVVEIDRAVGGVGLEVWGGGTETETGILVRGDCGMEMVGGLLTVLDALLKTY